MTINPLDEKRRDDVVVHAVDHSPGGMGLVVDRSVSPGLVVIRSDSADPQYGILLWTKEQEIASYRAGIQFISTYGKKEEPFREEEEGVFTLPEFRDPRLVASILVDEIMHIEGVMKRNYY